MTLSDINSLFNTLPQIERTNALLEKKAVKIQWKGVSGSSKAFCASSIARKNNRNHLFVLSDKEDAAYFFNDLEAINNNDKQVLFFPEKSSQKLNRNKIDSLTAISRAEVLERCALAKNTWVVTYPDALIEKVPRKKEINDKILTIQKGVCYSVEFFNELLIISTRINLNI